MYIYNESNALRNKRKEQSEMRKIFAHLDWYCGDSNTPITSETSKIVAVELQYYLVI